MLAQVFEGETEFLEPTDIFDCDRDNLLLLYTRFLFRFIHTKLRFDRLLTDKLWDLNLSCQHYFEALYLGGLPAISQEIFHTSLELSFEKFFKTFCESEFLISICKQTDVNQRQQIFGFGRSGRPDNNNEVLFSLWSQFKCDSFCEFSRDGVLNIPSFVLPFTVTNLVASFLRFL